MIYSLLNKLQKRKQLHIFREDGKFYLVLKQGKEQQMIGEYETYDEAVEWALKLSDQSERPKLSVYYHEQLITKERKTEQ